MRLGILMLMLLLWTAAIPATLAQQATTGDGQQAAPTGQPDPAKLHQLADLLNDPAIHAWLVSGSSSGGSPASTGQPIGGANRPASSSSMPMVSMPGGKIEQAIVDKIEATRLFLRDLAAVAPKVPAELSNAWLVLSIDLEREGLSSVVFALVAFIALGFGVEKLFWWATTGFRHRMTTTAFASPRDRFRTTSYRLVYGLGVVLAFAVGSIGAFLLLDWQPLLQFIVLSYLQVVFIIRIVLVLGRFLLAPGAERFRLLPMSTPAARFWFVWSAMITGWFFFVQHSLHILNELGVARDVIVVLSLPCGLVLFAFALYTVWASPEATATARVKRAHRIGPWALSFYLAGVWLMLFTGSTEPFYIGVILLLLPLAIRGTNRMAGDLLRPSTEPSADGQVSPLVAVSLERGLRAAMLIGGAWLIASLLEIDLSALTVRDTLPMRLLRGVINASIVILLADFVWHLVRSWIDQQVLMASGRGGESEDARRYARLRTLFPILKNVLFIVLIVLTVMIALSALGFEIGPLIAGAGVVGVAVGFGAQTLVKDIISGIFFLIDDAFRIGEYIESGSIRGTVESFSLRSIKLRHHRGALHTIPFGSIEKVTNYSRDWVIDKITISVTYDTDLEQVKKVIKEIGKQLQADQEFAPHILETLKMQGVEQFGDFAIQIRMKMMTKPGEQFVIRRRAYAMIKAAFDANGINFAFPTVTVSGGSTQSGAMGKMALDALQVAPE